MERIEANVFFFYIREASKNLISMQDNLQEC